MYVRTFFTNPSHRSILFSPGPTPHTLTVPHSFKLSYLARPVAERRPAGYMFHSCLLVNFNDFCQTKYLKNYRSDPRQISRVGRTMAVDERSEVSFSIRQGTLPWQSIIWFYRMGVAGRRRLVAQPGGLTLGFVLHPVFFYFCVLNTLLPFKKFTSVFVFSSFIVFSDCFVTYARLNGLTKLN